MDDLISIIIPIHNAELYLRQCIDSVRNQSYRNLEIILVDDGSTDKSGSICDEYQKNDKRIKVIHKKDEGVTCGRKAGLEISTGKYIGFVDSDDWIDLKMYEELLREAKLNNADIVTSGRFIETDNDCVIEYDGLSGGIYNPKSDFRFIDNMIYLGDSWREGILKPIWNKIFKRDIVLRNYEELDDRVIHCEDEAVLIASVLDSKKVVILHEAFYHYRQREGSVKRCKDELYFERMNVWYDYIKHTLSTRKHTETFEKKIDKLMAEQIIHGLFDGFKFYGDGIIPKYVFPLDKLKTQDKIVIYGAGVVGKSYYRQLSRNNNYSIVLWVDKKCQNYEEIISPVGLIKKVVFDKIIIAVKSEERALQIIDELKNLGIKKEKVMWTAPISILDYL